MDASLTALIYFGTFLILGIGAKRLVDRWMRKRDLELSEIQAQAGRNRGKRRVFLLGIWREEE
jgi:hypothetical protein